MSLDNQFEDLVNDDVTQLEVISERVSQGCASNEDLQYVRLMATKYLPNQIVKISPRLLGREASLESIEFLKQTAGKAVAIGIIVLITALIGKILGLGSESSDSGGGGGSSTAKKLDDKVAKLFEGQLAELREITIAMNTQAPMQLSDVVPQAVAEIASSSPGNYHAAPDENLTEEEQTLYSKHADTVKLIKAKYGSLKPADLKRLVKEYVAVSSQIETYITHDVLNADSKVTTQSVKDFLKEVSSGDVGVMSIMQRQRENTALRRPIINDKKLYEHAVSTKSEFINNALDKFQSLLDKYLGYVEEFKSATGETIEGIARSRNLPSGLKTNSSGALGTMMVEALGKSFSGYPTGLDKELVSVREAFTGNGDDIALAKAINPSVLIGIIRSAMLSDDLKQYDKLDKDLDKLKTRITDLGNALTWLDKVIGALSNDNPAKGYYNTLYADLDYLSATTKRLLNSAGFIKAGDIRIADQLIAMSGKLSQMQVRFGKLNEAIREAVENGAVSNESFPITEINPTGISFVKDLDPSSINPIAQRVLPMREIRIPKGAILPAGIDIHGLRGLVEEDPTDWSHSELNDYVESASASLESLNADVAVLTPVVNRIRRTGMISQADVYIIEKMKPGLITSKTPIGRFSSFESVNYAQPSLEDAQKLHQGAQAVVAIAGIAIIAKIIQWCYKRFQMSRDSTMAIKGRVEVIGKMNDQAIAMFTGLNSRVDGMPADSQGKLKDTVGKHLVAKGVGKDWFNFKDYEKSMYDLRQHIFVKNHGEREGGNKGLSELVASIIEGGDGFKLLHQVDESCNKGGTVLEKAVDTVEGLIKAAGNGSQTSFTGIDYGFNTFSIKDLKLSQDMDNSARTQLITNYITDHSVKILPKDKLEAYPVDKINSNLKALSDKLAGLDGKLDKSFEKLTKRLDKLETSNNQSVEQDGEKDGDIAASRVATKGYIDSLRTEFQTYSALLGAQTTLLKLVEKEVTAYQATIKDWSTEIKSITKLQTNAAKAPT